MKTRIILPIAFLFYITIFSQQKKIDTVYIKYNNSIDQHYNKKGKVNYFDICLYNKIYKRFQYGTSGVKKAKVFTKKEITRKELYQIIQTDSPNKNLVFIIIKKQNNLYYLYKSDYIFRTIRDK
ncbi:hypothetical protein ACKW6Q_22435 [Chryseobacterium kwangjuense]|uniref:Uncharacterized protein n=1 Tax=Chryseobacterium kwangjuense TaxID=267125 RepID=A0ABW9K8X7_9FLAO